MKSILLSAISLLIACSGDVPSSVGVSTDSDQIQETNDGMTAPDGDTPDLLSSEADSLNADSSDACSKESMCKGKDCGFVNDKCGNTYSCGPETCSAPHTCGGGGVPNVCGCTAKTKDEACLGLDCGTISNGCNPTLVYNCGTDPSSKTFPLVCPLLVSTGTSYAYRFCVFNKCSGCGASTVSCVSKPGYPIALNCPTGYSHGGGGVIPFFAVSTDCVLMGDGAVPGNKDYCCVNK